MRWACRAARLPGSGPTCAHGLHRSTARPRPPLALDALENQVLLDTLNSERFADTAPAAIHATLLDEGRYLGSVSLAPIGRRSVTICC